uniref:Uncharacterized protein n=1 Tax=Arundo donax TaxID=35708 RepID=A0A0A9BTP3_ARUDO
MWLGPAGNCVSAPVLLPRHLPPVCLLESLVHLVRSLFS